LVDRHYREEYPSGTSDAPNGKLFRDCIVEDTYRFIAMFEQTQSKIPKSMGSTEGKEAVA
jgi:hypothetical protein